MPGNDNANRGFLSVGDILVQIWHLFTMIFQFINGHSVVCTAFAQGDSQVIFMYEISNILNSRDEGITILMLYIRYSWVSVSCYFWSQYGLRSG